MPIEKKEVIVSARCDLCNKDFDPQVPQFHQEKHWLTKDVTVTQRIDITLIVAYTPYNQKNVLCACCQVKLLNNYLKRLAPFSVQGQ